MKLDVPHGLRRLPPAPELRRTQDTANPSHKEHIYLYVLYLVIFTFSNAFIVPFQFWIRYVPIRCVSSSLSERDEGGRESNGFSNCILR